LQSTLEGRMEGEQPRGRKRIRMMDDIRKGSTYAVMRRRVENREGGSRHEEPAFGCRWQKNNFGVKHVTFKCCILFLSCYRSCFFQPLSVHGWTLAFLLNVRRLCGVIEGNWAIFCYAGSGVWSARENPLKIFHGRELNPGYEDRQMRFIHSPNELSWVCIGVDL